MKSSKEEQLNIIKIAFKLMEFKSDATRNAIYLEQHPQYEKEYKKMLEESYKGISETLLELADAVNFPRENMKMFGVEL